MRIKGLRLFSRGVDLPRKVEKPQYNQPLLAGFDGRKAAVTQPVDQHQSLSGIL